MDDKIQQMVTAVLEAVDARLDGIRHELVQFATDADQRHHDVLGTVATLQRRIDELAARPMPNTVQAPVPADNHQSVADLNERLAQATKILVERMEAAQRDAALATDRKVAQLAEQIELVRSTIAAAATRMPAPTTDAPPSPMTSPTVGAAVGATAGTAVALAGAVEASRPPAVEPEAHTPAAAMSGSFGHVTGQLPHLNDDALAEISRPLYANGHVTGSTPHVTDTARVRQVTAPPIPPLVTPSMSPTGTTPPGTTPPGTTPPGMAPPAHLAHEDIDLARLTSLISEKLDHLSLPNRPE